MKKLLPILTIGAVLLSSMSVVGSANAATADVDMVDACQTMYPGAASVEVVLVEHNVMGWKCMLNGINYKLGIDVGAWCKRKYGKGAASKYRDFNNPYSWYCEY